MHVEGAFSITDESESGSEPDGFIVLLDDYGLDWEHRDSGDTTWEPSLHGGQHGGSLEIDGSLRNRYQEAVEDVKKTAGE